jgi:tetratricopeptide (TPR) repeat protein
MFSPLGGSNRLEANSMMQCELLAVLPGYRSDRLMLEQHRRLNDSNVGTIVLHREKAQPGSGTVSGTTLFAPAGAKKAYKKAVKLGKRHKWDRAKASLMQAVTEYPSYAEAWYALGLLHETQRDISKARDAYRKAIDADDRFPAPYMRIAVLAAQEENWSEVADTTGQVLRINALDFPGARKLNSLANSKLRTATLVEPYSETAAR